MSLAAIPLTMIPWILNEFRVSLLGSRYRAFFFCTGREKIREGARNDETIVHGRIQMRPFLKSRVLKNVYEGKAINITFEWITIENRGHVV